MGLTVHQCRLPWIANPSSKALQYIGDLLKLVAERNPDFYEYFNGKLRRAR
jgi:hypothetical protein